MVIIVRPAAAFLQQQQVTTPINPKARPPRIPTIIHIVPDVSGTVGTTVVDEGVDTGVGGIGT